MHGAQQSATTVTRLAGDFVSSRLSARHLHWRPKRDCFRFWCVGLNNLQMDRYDYTCIHDPRRMNQDEPYDVSEALIFATDIHVHNKMNSFPEPEFQISGYIQTNVTLHLDYIHHIPPGTVL